MNSDERQQGRAVCSFVLVMPAIGVADERTWFPNLGESVDAEVAWFCFVRVYFC